MRILAFIMALAISGAAHAATLADDNNIATAVNETFSPRLAEMILATPYDGMYKVSGKMKRRGNYNFNRVRKNDAFPDERWKDEALDVLDRVGHTGSANSVGSRVTPTATATVIMYKGGIEGIKHTGEGESLALVVINEKNSFDPNMPSVKGSGTALYLMDLSMVE